MNYMDKFLDELDRQVLIDAGIQLPPSLEPTIQFTAEDAIRLKEIMSKSQPIITDNACISSDQPPFV